MNDTFVKTSLEGFPLYLKSSDYIFVGATENKANAVSMGVFPLDDYVKAALKYKGHENAHIYDFKGITSMVMSIIQKQLMVVYMDT